MNSSSSPPLDEGVLASGTDTPSRSIVVPDGASVEAKGLALELERELARATVGQLRIDDPDKFAALTGGAGVWSWLDWLGRADDDCPTWGSKARDEYLDELWRDEPLLSGVMFSMVSRIAVTGWTISGPVDLLKDLWALFGEAETNKAWSYLVRPVAQNYLATDIGGIVQHPRDDDDMVGHLYYLPSRRCLAGPIRWKDDVWDLLYQDVDGSWKGLQNPQFTRICSLPDTDPLMRQIGFCFLSRCQKVGRSLRKLREYKDEKLDNLPPEGIASVTGLTKTQVEAAIALYTEERKRNKSLTFPGVLWLVANTFGQQASVAFTSFRDVWEGFDDRNEHEIAMKTISLDAGVDVGEFWQVEFHGATKAASERQHRKALGKGPAEFMVDFERAATSWLPHGCVWQFDVIDDAQDLVVEQVRAARLRNILDLWRPDPVLMQGLITTEQAQELLAQERVVPQRFFMPKESIVTDIIRELTGRDVGTIDQDGTIYRHRQYWQLNSGKKKEASLPDAHEIKRQLDKQSTTIGIILAKIREVLVKWREAIAVALEGDEDFDWLLYASTEMLPALAASFELAIQEAIKQSDFIVSQTGIRSRVNELARQMAFDLVNLDNPKGIALPRKNFLDTVRTQLGTGELAWADLESKLGEMFGEYRARLISRTETTTLWAKAHKLAATEAGMGYKRSIRAELGRPCPTNVCPDNQAEGWIPIGQNYAATDTAGPAYHPHCYCYEQFSLEVPE